MGLLISVLFIVLVAVVGLWLLKAVVFGIGIGMLLAVLGLAAVFLAAVGFGGSFAFVIYLLIKLFMLLFVAAIILGVIYWIKDLFTAGC